MSLSKRKTSREAARALLALSMAHLDGEDDDEPQQKPAMWPRAALLWAVVLICAGYLLAKLI